MRGKKVRFTSMPVGHKKTQSYPGAIAPVNMNDSIYANANINSIFNREIPHSKHSFSIPNPFAQDGRLLCGSWWLHDGGRSPPLCRTFVVCCSGLHRSCVFLL